MRFVAPVRLPPYGAARLAAQAFTPALPFCASFHRRLGEGVGRHAGTCVEHVHRRVRLRARSARLERSDRPGEARIVHELPVRNHLRVPHPALTGAAGRSLTPGLVLRRHSAYLSRVSETVDIDLSPSAAARVAAIAARQGKAPILRLAVEGGGCAGFQYRFGLADEIAGDDLAVARDGVTLVVDEVSLDLVRGSTVDFVESLGGAAFQVTNPNAASGCGCGTSFSV